MKKILQTDSPNLIILLAPYYHKHNNVIINNKHEQINTNYV